eukprot:403347690
MSNNLSQAQQQQLHQQQQQFVGGASWEDFHKHSLANNFQQKFQNSFFAASSTTGFNSQNLNQVNGSKQPLAGSQNQNANNQLLANQNQTNTNLGVNANSKSIVKNNIVQQPIIQPSGMSSGQQVYGNAHLLNDQNSNPAELSMILSSPNAYDSTFPSLHSNTNLNISAMNMSINEFKPTIHSSSFTNSKPLPMQGGASTTNIHNTSHMTNGNAFDQFNAKFLENSTKAAFDNQKSFSIQNPNESNGGISINEDIANKLKNAFQQQQFQQKNQMLNQSQQLSQTSSQTQSDSTRLLSSAILNSANSQSDGPSDENNHNSLSSCMDIFQIYKTQSQSGSLLKGSLDTGIDVRKLFSNSDILSFENREDLSEKMISPFTSSSIFNFDSNNSKSQQSSLTQSNDSQSINTTSQSGFIDDHDCFQPQIQIPDCFKLQKHFEMSIQVMRKANDKVLFYMFYNLTLERQQLEAAQILKNRGWRFEESNLRWYKRDTQQPSSNNKSNQLQQQTVNMFDPVKWEIISLPLSDAQTLTSLFQ